jgi:hypothetical protein
MTAAIADVKRLLTRYLGWDDEAAEEKALVGNRKRKPKSLVQQRTKKRA